MNKKEIELMQGAYRFALSLTHDKEMAQDLLQESWLKICQKNGTILMDRGYLFTVIRNLFIDEYRHNQKFPKVEIDEFSLGVQSSFNMDHKMELARVERALGALVPHEREMLYLKFVEEYTAQEISEVTGKARGTILSLIHRAKNKLFKILGEPEEKGKTFQLKRKKGNE